MIEYIQAIIQTLCRIEVRGKENLDALLGSIQSLEKILEELKNMGQEDVDDGGQTD